MVERVEIVGESGRERVVVWRERERGERGERVKREWRERQRTGERDGERVRGRTGSTKQGKAKGQISIRSSS